MTQCRSQRRFMLLFCNGDYSEILSLEKMFNIKSTLSETLKSIKVGSHGVEDMVLIKSLTDQEIYNNLKTRLGNNQIYTYISDVLISVNPYHSIPGLYSSEQVDNYKNRFMNELPPHVFAIAEKAFRNLKSQQKRQCIIISGESGSGKTETARHLVQFFAAVSGGGNSVENIKRVISQSNPLLEAFGNAKTLRNDNSSRFGKYFEIMFDRFGKPLGGKITNYLLENSRVCNVPKKERNFHIFYQLLAGTDSKMREQLGLTNLEDYKYLSHSGCVCIEGVDDGANFSNTVVS